MSCLIDDPVGFETRDANDNENGGIDLGTSHSRVGVWRNGEVEIIADSRGQRSVASYVAFTDSKRLIGAEAASHTASDPHNTVFNAKRLLGRKFHDAVVQADNKLWPFTVVDGGGGRPQIVVHFKGETHNFNAEEIVGFVMGKLRDLAEAAIGEPVTSAVVSVPALATYAQREATKAAGAIAGLHVTRLLNEPTAAAISYSFTIQDPHEHHVLLVSCGAGCFGVTLFCLEDGVIEPKATAGDTHLGGVDFDERLVDYCVREFKRKHNRDLRTNPQAMSRLRAACERAKCALSASMEASIEIDALVEGVDFHATITRDDFEILCDDYFNRMLELLNKVLHDADVDKEKVTEAVLVGGSSQIPKVEQLLTAFLNGDIECKKVDVNESVAFGASVLAAVLNGDDIGCEKIEDILVMDMTSLPLGVETIDGSMETIILRNTTVPTKRTKTLRLKAPGDEIRVFEGEKAKADDNNLIGAFNIHGMRPAEEDQPLEIDVTLSIDMDGIITGMAVYKSNGEEVEVPLVLNTEGQLSREDIDHLAARAKSFKAEDDADGEASGDADDIDAGGVNGMHDGGERRHEGQSSERVSADARAEIEEKVAEVLDWLDALGPRHALESESEEGISADKRRRLFYEYFAENMRNRKGDKMVSDAE